MAVQPNDPFASSAAATTWTYLDLSTATKLDPSTIELATPVAAGDDFYTVTIDASGAIESPAVMLAYTAALAGVTMDQAYTLIMVISVLAESEIHLTLGGYACDAATSIGTSNGIWAALSREVIGVGGDVDGFSRLMSEIRPSLAAETAQYAAITLSMQHNPVEAIGHDTVYNTSSTGVLLPTGFEDHHGTSKVVASPGTSGSMYIGALIGCRGTGSASATAKIRVGYAVVAFPS